MAGHSKWANIKRRKGAQDAKRGKIFTKLVREVTTAARIGGGDPDANPRLRAAISAAKADRMPADNIERAIKKGAGELGDGTVVEETAYEGYASGGVAVFVEAQTDNKNRTTSEVRAVFSKLNGNLGAAGSVAWMFQRRGQFIFDAARHTEEELMEAALEAGASDVVADGDAFVVYSDVKDFAAVMDSLEKQGLSYARAGLTMIPENTIKVSGDQAQNVLKLVERLEDLDDVQTVYANFEIDDEELERFSSEG